MTTTLVDNPDPDDDFEKLTEWFREEQDKIVRDFLEAMSRYESRQRRT